MNIWNLQEKTLEFSFEYSTDTITSIAITSDNKYIAASDDKSVRIWSITGEKPEVVLKGHTSYANYLAVSSDNK